MNRETSRKMTLDSKDLRKNDKNMDKSRWDLS